MRFSFLAGFVLGLSLLGAGCRSPLLRKINPLAHINRKDKPASKKLAAQDEATGIIEMTRPAEGYVLLRLNGLAPPEDMELECYSANAPSGKIRFTGERKGPFLAADITEGKPNRGDVVVLRGGRRMAGRENGPSAADQSAGNLPALAPPPDGSAASTTLPSESAGPAVVPSTSVAHVPAPLAKPTQEPLAVPPVASSLAPPPETPGLALPPPASASAAEPARAVPPPLPDWVIEAQNETPVRKEN